MLATFPHMGNTYIVVKALLEDLGTGYVIPPFNNKRALELGTKYAPELACLPLKINIGNYIEASRQGADTILITGGHGPCRFGYYCEMHKEILKDAGYDMEVITLEIPDGNIKEFLRRVRRISGSLKPYKIINAVKNAAQVSKQVDALERLSFKIKPRETEKGSVDKILKNFRERVRPAEGSKEIKKVIESTRNEMFKVDVDVDYEPLKIGIVGEIYTSIDPYTNLDISSKLGNMGVEVDRAVTLSGWIINHIIKNALHLPVDTSYIEASRPYLGTMIGGHAQETIGNAVLYAKNGYDGVIQIYPLTCMPEIVAESILPAVGNDFDIPILTLITDEMTGEAGYLTRIEAFVDLLYKRREMRAVGKVGVLSGN